MSNRILYMTILAFAAAATVSANSTAKAETRGHATLAALIQEDLDQEQAGFAMALSARAGAGINARLEKTGAFFRPPAAPQALAETIDAVSTNTRDRLYVIATARAEFEIGKDAAAIETPFNPRPTVAFAVIAFNADQS